MAKLQKVLRADRSPMNARQWLCELECGHEQWRSSVRKPVKFECMKCAQEQQKGGPTKKEGK